MQPPNYTLNLPNPIESVMQGLQMRAMYDKQRAEQQRQQQMQADVADLQGDPTPEKYANFYLKYPEMKDQMTAYRDTLAEGDKSIMKNASGQMMAALTSGKPELVDQTFDKWITGLNETGRKDLAKQFDEAKQFYKADPKAGEFAIRSMFQSMDPDGYKSLTERPAAIQTYEYLLQKEGKDVALAAINADPNRITVLPNGGMIMPKGMAATMGAGAPQGGRVTKTINGVTYYQEGGKWFKDDTGGGSSDATGGF